MSRRPRTPAQAAPAAPSFPPYLNDAQADALDYLADMARFTRRDVSAAMEVYAALAADDARDLSGTLPDARPDVLAAAWLQGAAALHAAHVQAEAAQAQAKAAKAQADATRALADAVAVGLRALAAETRQAGESARVKLGNLAETTDAVSRAVAHLAEALSNGLSDVAEKLGDGLGDVADALDGDMPEPAAAEGH